MNPANPTCERLIDSVLGCIVGGAIGDAAGATHEAGIASPALENDNWFLTDDTQLTLATFEALTVHDTPDPARIAASFLRWFRAGRLTGLGASTLKALRDLDVGAHWALAGRKGERAAGNGAAMRIAPLAFCMNLQTDSAQLLVRDISRITHHNDEAIAGALAVMLAVREPPTGGQALDRIAAQLPDTSVRDRLLEYAALPADVTPADAAKRFGASGFVVESVPLALFAASQIGQLGFTGMLTDVIRAGGDTDSNAPIACQIGGASLGFAALPSDLLGRMPQPELVLPIARAFAERVASVHGR